MRTRLFVFLAGLALILGPTAGLPQPGGGDKGRGMRGGFSMDPQEMFNRFSGGKDFVSREDVPEMFRGIFDRVLERMGAANGQITRAQYLDYWQQRMAQRAAEGRGGPPPGPPSAPSQTPGPPPPPPSPSAPPAPPQGAPASQTAPSYPPYVPMVMIPELPEEENRTPVYRSGKLPANLPSWFKECDTDTDGQVGLYEWKRAARPMEEFAQMDRNGDGFLTAEEVLRATGTKPDSGSTGQTAVASAGSTAPPTGGPPPMMWPSGPPGPQGGPGMPGTFGAPDRSAWGGGDRGGFRGSRGGDEGGFNPGSSGRGRGSRGNRGSPGFDPSSRGSRGSGGFDPGSRGSGGFDPSSFGRGRGSRGSRGSGGLTPGSFGGGAAPGGFPPGIPGGGAAPGGFDPSSFGRGAAPGGFDPSSFGRGAGPRGFDPSSFRGRGRRGSGGSNPGNPEGQPNPG